MYWLSPLPHLIYVYNCSLMDVVYFCAVFSYLLPIGLHPDVNLHYVIINQGRWDATKNGLWPNCTLPRINKILKKKKKKSYQYQQLGIQNA